MEYAKIHFDDDELYLVSGFFLYRTILVMHSDAVKDDKEMVYVREVLR